MYIYIYICIHIHIYIYTYIHGKREREREIIHICRPGPKAAEPPPEGWLELALREEAVLYDSMLQYIIIVVVVVVVVLVLVVVVVVVVVFVVCVLIMLCHVVYRHMYSHVALYSDNL